jgi:ABC-type glycerol-3-phosphate transport system substrate-binding protein
MKVKRERQKMKNKSVKIAAILMVLLAPVLLAGCKRKCPNPTDNIPGTSTYRDDCPYEETNASQTGTRTLDLWVLYDTTDDYREQIQAFQSNLPGIRVQLKTFTNIDEYEDLVIDEIAEGEGPDVFMVHNSWMPQHYKKLLPIPLDQPVVMNADLFRQTYFQAAADDLIIDEQVYGMPQSIDNLAIFYNKQHFKDLIATSDQPGNLWEDIQDQVTQLTKRNNSPERFALAGIAMGRADNISSAIDILYALMLEFGVEFYDEGHERATFAVSDGGVEAFELFTSFALPSYRNYSWNEYITGFAPEEKEINPFVRGKVSMIIGYPYLYNEIKQGIQEQQRSGSAHIDIEDVGIAPFPQLVSGDEATSRNTYASYFPLVVARTTDMPQEAWTLVQYLTSADALQTYHKNTSRPTSRKDMVAEQQTEPLFGTFAFQAPFAKSFVIYNDSAYRKIFTDAVQNVVRNVASPRDALTEAQQKVTCVLQKERGLIDVGTDCNI